LAHVTATGKWERAGDYASSALVLSAVSSGSQRMSAWSRQLDPSIQLVAIKTIKNIKSTTGAVGRLVFIYQIIVNNLIFRLVRLGFYGFYGFYQIGKSLILTNHDRKFSLSMTSPGSVPRSHALLSPELMTIQGQS
jgi:hypothetical protein